MHRSALAPCSLEAFRVRDPAARGHPVHLTRTNHLLDPGRVAVHDFAREHVSHGREADMWVRSHIGFARQPFRQLDRTEMIEEYEGAHHVVVRMRQDAAHLESPQTAPSLINQNHARKPRACGAVSTAVRQTLGWATMEDVREWLPLI